MSRLLIAAINYWPEPTGTAPYTTQFAEHLASTGHDVSVLTGMPHYPAWRIFDGYSGRAQVDEYRHGVRITRRIHHVPRQQSAIERARYEGTFLFRGLAFRNHRVDAVIGIVPSLNGALLARLKSSDTRPYGILFQDLMGAAVQQSGIKGGTRAIAALTKCAERWALNRAAAVGAVSESFLPYLRSLGVSDSRLLHTPNWPLLPPPKLESDERETLRQTLGWPAGTQVVLHAGNMGLKQGLGQVIAAARLAERSKQPVLFVLMGDGNQRRTLEAEASGVRQLRFLNSQPSDRYMKVLAAADVLLASELASAVSMSLPSKLTSYYVAGRPIIAAVAPDGGTGHEVERSGAGMVVPAGHPQALLDLLEQFRATPALAAQLGASGPSYAEAHLGRESALERLETFTDMVIAGNRRG